MRLWISEVAKAPASVRMKFEMPAAFACSSGSTLAMARPVTGTKNITMNTPVTSVGHGHLHEGHVGAEFPHPPQHDAGQAEDAEADDRARVELLDRLADQGGAEHREDAHDAGRVSGPGRGVAHVGLQPERQDDDAGEEAAEPEGVGRRGADEAAVPEDPEVNDRVLLGQLPDHEGDEPDRGDDAVHPDVRIVEPVVVAALVEHDLQRGDPDDEQDKPDLVDERLRTSGSAWPRISHQSARPPAAATGTLM